MNNLVSELAVIAAQEKAMLDESEELLASTAAMQVRVTIYSSRTSIITTNHRNFFAVISPKYMLLKGVGNNFHSFVSVYKISHKSYVGLENYANVVPWTS